MIDHRITSANHPQANSAAEKAVQTLKSCLQRFVQSTLDKLNWDLFVPWIALGYRVTPQESSKMSPYSMLFATPPVIPPSVVERVAEALDFDNAEAAARSILERAALIQQQCVMVGQNLRIAQHRDTLNYARLRSGGYLPSVHQFKVGQYVYMRDLSQPLHPHARPEVLRVKEVRSSGVLILEGRDGNTMSHNMNHCSPCHLPIKALVTEKALPRPAHDLVCETCKKPDNPQAMILCDSCDRGFHTWCHHTPLEKVPRGKWLCSDCVREGVTLDNLQTREVAATDQVLVRQLRAGLRAVGRHKQKKKKAAAVDKAEPEEVVERPSATLRRQQRLVARSQAIVEETPKKGRGRPRKNVVVQANVVQVTALPACFTWWTVEGALNALSLLMPGTSADMPRVSEHHFNNARIVSDRSWQGSRFEGECSKVPVSEQEAVHLMSLIDLSLSFNIIVVCADRYHSFQKWIEHHAGEMVVSNSVDRRYCSHYNFCAMQPDGYHGLQQIGPLQAIFACPHEALVDAVLPLASSFAQHVAMFLVPMGFLSQCHAARARWLQELNAAGRLYVAAPSAGSSSRGQHGRVWLLVFKSEVQKLLMLQLFAPDSDQLELLIPSDPSN